MIVDAGVRTWHRLVLELRPFKKKCIQVLKFSKLSEIGIFCEGGDRIRIPEGVLEKTHKS